VGCIRPTFAATVLATLVPWVSPAYAQSPVNVPDVTSALPAPLQVTPAGGASGGPRLMLRNGDIQQVRNVQLGYCDDRGCDPNGDLGAGGDGTPGRGPRGALSLNYDVGKVVQLYDGQKGILVNSDTRGTVVYRSLVVKDQPHGHVVMRVKGDQIVFYRRPKVVVR
jgi:hypothetical protein